MATPYTAASGTLVVASATGMPTTGTFRIRLGNPTGTILRVDSRAGTTLTVTPEQDDGDADVGATATLIVTAGGLNQLKADAGGGGHLFQNISAVGNDANTNEKDLHTFTLPAGKLAANGDSVEVRIWVRCAANGNAKRTRVYFGATVIGDSTQQTFNNVGFWIVARIWRTGAATQLALCTATQPNVNSAWSTAEGGGFNTSTPAETLSGTVVIKVTGQSPVGAGANDVQALATDIYFIPAA